MNLRESRGKREQASHYWFGRTQAREGRVRPGRPKLLPAIRHSLYETCAQGIIQAGYVPCAAWVFWNSIDMPAYLRMYNLFLLHYLLLGWRKESLLSLFSRKIREIRRDIQRS